MEWVVRFSDSLNAWVVEEIGSDAPRPIGIIYEQRDALVFGLQQMRINKLHSVVRALLSRSKLLSGRWPCVDCGRESASAPLRSIEYKDGSLHGCWLCGTEDIRTMAEAALE